MCMKLLNILQYVTRVEPCCRLCCALLTHITNMLRFNRCDTKVTVLLYQISMLKRANLH